MRAAGRCRGVSVWSPRAPRLCWRVAIGWSVFGSETSGETLPCCPRTDRRDARSRRRGDTHEDNLGLADRARRHGTPRLDGGRFYQAWLRNPAGVLVPIGTFNEGQDVTLWAGVSPKEFTTLTITRERADGEQASSGQKVLVGTVDTGS